MNTKGSWDYSQKLVFMTGACSVVAGATIFSNGVPYVREVFILIFLIAGSLFVRAIGTVKGRS